MEKSCDMQKYIVGVLCVTRTLLPTSAFAQEEQY